MKQPKLKLYYRVIDANINRAKEGLRVCEEITRFLLNSRSLTAVLKKIRHEVSSALKTLHLEQRLAQTRDSLADVGQANILKKEFQRSDYKDIFFANIGRAEESIRVLEEFLKLQDIKLAARFKKIRYAVYEIEKKFAIRIRK